MDRLRQRLAQAEEHFFGIKHQQPTMTTCPTIQHVLDPALTTPLTVLACAVAAKYILDVLILVLPFALALGSRISSSLSRHHLRSLLRYFIFIVLLSSLLHHSAHHQHFHSQPHACPPPPRKHHHIRRVRGFEGGYAEDASFYCHSSFDSHDFYRVFMKLPYFALGRVDRHSHTRGVPAVVRRANHARPYLVTSQSRISDSNREGRFALRRGPLVCIVGLRRSRGGLHSDLYLCPEQPSAGRIFSARLLHGGWNIYSLLDSAIFFRVFEPWTSLRIRDHIVGIFHREVPKYGSHLNIRYDI